MAAAFVELEAHGDAMRGARERVVDVAVFDDVLGDEIVRTIEARAWRARRKSCDRIGDHGKRISIDVDETKRVFGDGAAFGDDDGNRFAHIGQLVTRQRIGIDRKADRGRRQRERNAVARQIAGADRRR